MIHFRQLEREGSRATFLAATNTARLKSRKPLTFWSSTREVGGLFFAAASVPDRRGQNMITDERQRERIAEWAGWLATMMHLVRMEADQLQTCNEASKLKTMLEMLEHDARGVVADMKECEQALGPDAAAAALERAKEICLERELEYERLLAEQS